ncbi:MAG: hypothetical protein ABEL76_03740 [Bradymonadaceae bacterium]
MPGLLTFLIGAAAITAESALWGVFAHPSVGAQVGLAFVLWAALRREFETGAFLALGWFPFVGWTVGAPGGSYVLAAAGTFVALAAATRDETSTWGFRQVAAGAAGGALHAALFLAILAAAGAKSHLMVSVARAAPLAVVQTTIVLWPLGWAMEQIDERLSRRT